MTTKRILITSFFYEFRFGGAELVARTIKRNMESRCGIEVDVLCFSGSTTPESSPNIYRIQIPPVCWRQPNLFKRVILFLNNSAFDRWMIWQINKLPINWAGYDLFHCQDLNALQVTYRLAKRHQKPIVFTLHDALPKTLYPGQTISAATMALNFLLLRRAVALKPAIAAAAQVICVSHFIQKKLTQFMVGQPISSTVIYPPIEEYMVNGQPSQVLPNSVLFIGRLSKEKGLDLLIKALDHLPNVSLSILGLEGPLKPWVSGLEKTNPRIRFIKPVPHDQVMSIIREHAVVCCPSMFEEPFGKTVLESRIAGKPLVASDLGGIPEIVTGYPNAVTIKAAGKSEAQVTVALAEAIKAALTKTDLVNGEGESEFLSQFTIDTVLNKHLAFYYLRT